MAAAVLLAAQRCDPERGLMERRSLGSAARGGPGPFAGGIRSERASLPDATRLNNLLLISAAVVSKLSGGKNRKQAVSLKFKWIQCTQRIESLLLEKFSFLSPVLCSLLIFTRVQVVCTS